MEKIVIEVLPIDTEGRFVSNHDCSLARAIKRHFNDPEMRLNVGLDDVKFGGNDNGLEEPEQAYKITSVLAYEPTRISFKRVSDPIMWGYNDHLALKSGELTRAEITLEKIY